MRTLADYSFRHKIYQSSSIQYHLSADLADEIVLWGEENIRDEDLFEQGLMFGREFESHVTISNGIQETSVDKIVKIFNGIKPFEITLKEISYFTCQEKFDVVKIDVESDIICYLNRMVSSKVDVFEGYLEYKPHVTIAFVKKHTGGKLSSPFYNTVCKVDKLMLSSPYGDKTKIHLS